MHVRYKPATNSWEVSGAENGVFFDLLENFPQQVKFAKYIEFTGFIESRPMQTMVEDGNGEIRFARDSEGNKRRRNSRYTSSYVSPIPPISQPPAVSPVGSGRIYFNGTKFRVSENAGPYADLGSFYSCRLDNVGAAQSIATSSLDAVTFDTEKFDNGNMHSSGAPSRITIPVAGVYNIGAHIRFAVSAAGGRTAFVRLNGATFIAVDSDLVVTAALPACLNVNTLYQFAAGDYIEVIAFQDSGGALSLDQTSETGPIFWCYGPITS